MNLTSLQKRMLESLRFKGSCSDLRPIREAVTGKAGIYIFWIINPAGQLRFYIGRSKDMWARARFLRHRSQGFCDCAHFRNAINKYGFANFNFGVIVFLPDCCTIAMKILESYYMHSYLPNLNIRLEMSYFDDVVEEHTGPSKTVSVKVRESGNIIEFPSGVAAAKFIGVHKSTLWEAIQKKSLVRREYYVSYDRNSFNDN